MPLKVKCQHCRSRLSIRDDLAGKKIKCPKCGQSFLATTEETSEPEQTTGEKLPRQQKREPGLPQKTSAPSQEFPEKKRPTTRQSKAAIGAPEYAEPQWEVGDDDLQPLEDSFDQLDVPPSSLPPRRSSASRRQQQQPAAGAVPSKQSNVQGERYPKRLVAIMRALAGIAAGLTSGLLIGLILFSGSRQDDSPSDASAADSTGPVEGSEDRGGNSPPGQEIKLPEPTPEMTEAQLREAADIRQVIGEIPTFE